MRPKETQRQGHRGSGVEECSQRRGVSESSKRNQKALTKYLKGRGSQIGKTGSQVCDETVEDESKRTETSASREEDNRTSERRKKGATKDGKTQEDELPGQMEKLMKDDLAKVSTKHSHAVVSKTEMCHKDTDKESSGGNLPISQSKKLQESGALRVDTASKSRTSERKEDHLLKPMAFESQLMKSRTKDTSTASKAGRLNERTKAQTKHDSYPGDKGGSKESGKNTGGGRILIRPEDFQRRHVNQLFLRGDNVVLVSVDKAFLESK